MRFDRPYNFSFAPGLVNLELKYIYVSFAGQCSLMLHGLRNLRGVSLNHAIPTLYSLPGNIDGACEVPALMLPDGLQAVHINMPPNREYAEHRKVASLLTAH